MSKWWLEPFQLFQSNIRVTDGELDTDEATALIRDLGYSVWLLNAGGISSFYPIQDDDQRESPAIARRPSGDLIGDALLDCRRTGLRLVARFDFSRLPADIMSTRSEWAFRTATGETCELDGLVNICPRSDYYEIRVPQIIQSFIDRYDIDGIFFNFMQFPMFSYNGDMYGTCHCDRCRSAFAQVHPDVDYPAGFGDDAYPLLSKVNDDYLQSLADRYNDLVKRRRPFAALFLADARGDMIFLETNSPIEAAEGWWAHTPSELASVHQTAHPELPALVHASANVGVAYRLVAEEPAQFARYAAQALARGARPSTVVIGAPTTQHVAAFEATRAILATYGANQNLYAELKPAAPVALVRPPGGTAMAAITTRSNFAEYRGLFESMQRSHIPFDVLGAANASELWARGALKTYQAIVAPSDVVRDKFADLLLGWAQEGGRLVITGDPSTIPNLDVEVLDQLAGPRQLGGRYGGRPDGQFGDRLPLIGEFWGINKGDASDWYLSDKAPFGPPELTYGNEGYTPYPLRTRVPYGVGSITLLPWTVGKTVRASGLSSVADFVVDTVLECTGPMPVTAVLPTSVEIILGEAKGVLVIHLINHSGGRPERIVDPIPVSGSIRVPATKIEPPRVVSLTGSHIDVKFDAGEWVIDVNFVGFEAFTVG